MNETTSVWDRLDSLSEQELDALLVAAASVLAEDDQEAQQAVVMPPGPAARELRSELEGAGVEVADGAAEGLVEDEGRSREVALATLRELAKQPELAAEIGQAYQERSRMMAFDFGLITGPVLLLLVLKLKRVKIKKGEGLDVEFYEAKGDVLGAVRTFFGA